MRLGEIITLIVFMVFVLPLLLTFVGWAISSVINPTPENIEKGTELIAQAATPWWVTVFQWIGDHTTGLLATILILGIILILKYNPQLI